MSEIKRILDQLKRSFEGEAWHGPSVREALANVNAEKAAAHPLPAAHSIWEITEHIAAWQHFVCKRLEGEQFEATPEQDWPAIPSKDEQTWQKTLSNLEQGYRKLSSAIGRINDKELDQTYVPGKPYTLYFLIHGIIQHNLFHAGQISLLKKSV
jgi:uncharacterized damage-inducible protein DinB